jgi:hypothetical protein
MLIVSICLTAVSLLYSLLGSFLPCQSSTPIKHANAVVMAIVGFFCVVSVSLAAASDTMKASSYEKSFGCTNVSRKYGAGYWCAVASIFMAASRCVAFLRSN